MPPPAGPFLRSYRMGAFMGYCVAVAIVVVLLPSDPQPIPFRLGVVAEPWPLLMGLLACGLPVLLAAPGWELESPVPVRPFQTRALVTLSSVLIVGAIGAISVGLINREFDIAIRNYAICAALTYASALIIAPSWTWFVPMAFAAGNWLYGVDQQSRPKSWAVLMYGDHVGLLAASVALLALSMAMWVWHGPRHEF